MADLRNVTTVALAEELMRRANHVDALISLVNGGGALDPKPKTEPEPPRRRMATGTAFLRFLQEHPEGCTAEQIARGLGCTQPAAVAHMHRSARIGTVELLGPRNMRICRLKAGGAGAT